MKRKPRSHAIIEADVSTYHVIARSVSRGFLMGDDPFTGDPPRKCDDGCRGRETSQGKIE